MGNRKALLPLSMMYLGSKRSDGYAHLCLYLADRERIFLTHTATDSRRNHTIRRVGGRSGCRKCRLILLGIDVLPSGGVPGGINLRKEAMRQIVRMPLGFFDLNTSGKIRKVIDDNAGITHSFLAHQMPDLAGSVLVPLTAVILIFTFDWKLGLVCIIPVAVAMFLMGHLMNTQGQAFMRAYMTSLEEMNTEAVEYVRGIPVIKVFQQTIYSFKNFHKSIMAYNQMASSIPDCGKNRCRAIRLSSTVSSFSSLPPPFSS